VLSIVKAADIILIVSRYHAVPCIHHALVDLPVCIYSKCMKRSYRGTIYTGN